MNHARSIVATLLGLVGAASAEPGVALDYHAKASGCPTADRFADEVAAKLGFVPWDPEALTAIRVRISEDSGDLVGTIEQPDGTSKVLRAARCTALNEALVTALAVTLDRSAQAPAPERRLQTLERQVERDPESDVVTIRVRELASRPLQIDRVVATALLTRSSERATSVERICHTTPCTARLARGSSMLLIRDVAHDTTVTADVDVGVSSSLVIDDASHADERATRRRRMNIGGTLGFFVGAISTAVVVSRHGGGARHLLDLVGGWAGGGLGVLIGASASPNHAEDTVRVTVRPGLRDATAGF
jgi:hypothetical protein